jgi:hypothetical protein
VVITPFPNGTCAKLHKTDSPMLTRQCFGTNAKYFSLFSLHVHRASILMLSSSHRPMAPASSCTKPTALCCSSCLPSREATRRLYCYLLQLLAGLKTCMLVCCMLRCSGATQTTFTRCRYGGDCWDNMVFVSWGLVVGLTMCTLVCCMFRFSRDVHMTCQAPRCGGGFAV